MLEGRSQARKQQGLSDAEGERREAMRCGVMMLPMSIHAKEWRMMMLWLWPQGMHGVMVKVMDGGGVVTGHS